MPHGAMGELLPALEELHRTPTQIVLGLRDIIDAPEVVHEGWSAEGAFDALGSYYDQVLVDGSRDVFNMAEQYKWPLELGELIDYCGYPCMPARVRDLKRIRARRRAAGQPGMMVVATAGGGADGYELMSTLLEAFPEVSAVQPCTLVFITGPFMPEAERKDLKRRSEGLPVR